MDCLAHGLPAKQQRLHGEEIRILGHLDAEGAGQRASLEEYRLLGQPAQDRAVTELSRAETRAGRAAAPPADGAAA